MWCGGIACGVPAVASLLAGAGNFTPHIAVQALTALGGPCAFFLCGPEAFLWSFCRDGAPLLI